LLGAHKLLVNNEIVHLALFCILFTIDFTPDKFNENFS
jgi:hypothetical protein